MSTLYEHVLESMENGRYSDVTVKAFGKTYKLNKQQLSISPYFESLFEKQQQQPLSETDVSTPVLTPVVPSYDPTIPNYMDDDDDDNPNRPLLNLSTVPITVAITNTNTQPDLFTFAKQDDYYELEFNDYLITRESFELMLFQMYGCPQTIKENRILINLLITSNFFKYDELSNKVGDSLLKNMTADNAHEILELVKRPDMSNLGDLITKLTNAANAHLNNPTYEDGIDAWDKIPDDTVVALINDSFEQIHVIIQLFGIFL